MVILEVVKSLNDKIAAVLSPSLNQKQENVKEEGQLTVRSTMVVLERRSLFSL